MTLREGGEKNRAGGRWIGLTMTQARGKKRPDLSLKGEKGDRFVEWGGNHAPPSMIGKHQMRASVGGKMKSPLRCRKKRTKRDKKKRPLPILLKGGRSRKKRGIGAEILTAILEGSCVGERGRGNTARTLRWKKGGDCNGTR